MVYLVYHTSLRMACGSYRTKSITNAILSKLYIGPLNATILPVYLLSVHRHCKAGTRSTVMA